MQIFGVDCQRSSQSMTFPSFSISNFSTSQQKGTFDSQQFPTKTPALCALGHFDLKSFHGFIHVFYIFGSIFIEQIVFHCSLWLMFLFLGRRRRKNSARTARTPVQNWKRGESGSASGKTSESKFSSPHAFSLDFCAGVSAHMCWSAKNKMKIARLRQAVVWWFFCFVWENRQHAIPFSSFFTIGIYLLTSRTCKSTLGGTEILVSRLQLCVSWGVKAIMFLHVLLPASMIFWFILLGVLDKLSFVIRFHIFIVAGTYRYYAISQGNKRVCDGSEFMDFPWKCFEQWRL